MKRHLQIFTDGACSGNPGPAGVGVVIKEGDKTLKELSIAIGDATNNIAEYTALLYGLQEALVLKATQVEFFTDSELMCRQLQGAYKVKEPAIKFLFDLCQHAREGIKGFSITHIPREKNKQADRLATSAIKSVQQAKMVTPLFEPSANL